MIANKELARELASIAHEVCLDLDRSAALVRARSESEAAEYATAVANVFMCVYSHILDPIYVDHPDIAPPSWELYPETERS
jgi:hypothetical protein